MARRASEQRVIRFGVFEVDFVAAELRKRGPRVKLEAQPFQVLCFLVRRPGALVTREALRDELWPGDTFVEFDHSLNTAVKKIRDTLGDSAQNPTFIETEPRKGYRFIAPVEAVAEEETPSPQTERRAVAAPVLWALAGVIVGALLTIWLWPRPAGPDLPLRKFSFSPGGVIHDPVISPNGRHIAYAAEGKLWVQDLDQEEPRELVQGLLQRGGHSHPFWSPDSRHLGFAEGTTLKRIAISGGQAIEICELPIANFTGGSWSQDGSTIVYGRFSADTGSVLLYEVAAQGGEEKLLTNSDWLSIPQTYPPTFLPLEGRKVVLFTGGGEIHLRDLDSGEERSLTKGSRPVYSSAGHILYESSSEEEGLWALPFSLARLEAIGESFFIAHDGLMPSVARDGTLVYLDRAGQAIRQLVLRDRRGRWLDVIGRAWLNVDLSPDDSTVAATSRESGNPDIWLHDVQRGVKNRLTHHAASDWLPVWSPLSDKLIFTSNRNGTADILMKSVDGSDEATPVLAVSDSDYVRDWSHDEKYILFTRYHEETRADQWYFEWTPGGDPTPTPFLNSPFGESDGKFSPDGRYVAYLSDETGQYEVYVQEFPGGGSKVKVSAAGGSNPRWRRDGRELFYAEGDTLVAVPVTTLSELSIGVAKKLFRTTGGIWDVTADGQRFVIAEPVDPDAPPVIRVVQNWYAEFEDRERGER